MRRTGIGLRKINAPARRDHAVVNRECRPLACPQRNRKADVERACARRIGEIEVTRAHGPDVEIDRIEFHRGDAVFDRFYGQCRARIDPA